MSRDGYVHQSSADDESVIEAKQRARLCTPTQRRAKFLFGCMWLARDSLRRGDRVLAVAQRAARRKACVLSLCFACLHNFLRDYDELWIRRFSIRVLRVSFDIKENWYVGDTRERLPAVSFILRLASLKASQGIRSGEAVIFECTVPRSCTESL